MIGERYDGDAGLQYLNARYYDPKLAMFIQPDWWEVTKAGVGTNRYSYSFDDPVNKSDPSGNGILGKPLRELSERAARAAVKAARERAVKDAWKMEKQMVEKTGTGTVDWTKNQVKELLKDGKVEGYIGHHRNTVNGNLDLAANHRNIEFVPEAQHMSRHPGGTKLPISGEPLIDRTLGGALPDLATEGALGWPERVLGAVAVPLGSLADVLDAVDPYEQAARQSGYYDLWEMLTAPPGSMGSRAWDACFASQKCI